jgi:hypothetical protein
MSRLVDVGVPPFDPQTFGSDHRFARIGTGSIGGKAAGLLQIQEQILPRFEDSRFDDVEVLVPQAVVIATEVFKEFVERNRLRRVASSDAPDSEIALAFQRGELTPVVRGALRRLLDMVQAPLAVRPSSFLEDAEQRPFAGLYTSKMIPNAEDNLDARYRRLANAIKLTWASTFFENALLSRRAAGLADDAEQMAVVVQEVFGERFDGRFYPTLSAVARSYNHYPTPGNKREDGVVMLALGLGKAITDGEHVWSYCPHRALAPPPFKSTADLLKYTQTSFWAVNLGEAPPATHGREDASLMRCALGDAEADETLSFVASTYDPASDQVRSGIASSGPRALTFAPLLESRTIPFTPVLERLLELACNANNGEAEVEIAAVLDRERALPMRVGVVQVRPMLTPGERTPIEEGELESAEVLVSSDNCLGQGAREDLTDVVYLRPQHFDRGLTKMIATELDAVNRGLVEEGRRGVFIGHGRWGTTDDRFGVPVRWGQISTARVIVEVSLPDSPATLSHGTHFFHRLLSHRVLYMSVEPGGHGHVDWEWLDAQEAIWESRHVRHVRIEQPLDVRIDCATRRGLIRRRES